MKTISNCIMTCRYDGSYTMHAYGSERAYVNNYRATASSASRFMMNSRSFSSKPAGAEGMALRFVNASAAKIRKTRGPSVFPYAE